YFYRARYYSPALGRFISEDPIQFSGGINFYQYAADSPLNFVDPFGTDIGSNGGGSNGGGPGPPPPPPPLAPKQPCYAAVALGAVSVVFDVLGAIPGLGNLVSASVAGARAVDGIVAYSGAAYGIATGLPDEAPYGAASAGAALGLTLADAALEGGKVIPGLGNALSVHRSIRHY
ncbi:MAG: RHS repeat-associated core domain-containing protein, partial [Candidatus Sulfotelmatobacter sp.]